ncbi:MAG: MiaB/RimO family radical SAM methylthiotransferase [Phycisphaerales bacterium]|nr:MAG: MiaB/RimO family radical SAM methylthiotransferase [Phycisphaerales bacterium]
MASRTVYLETFGCQMNELDSELVAGALRALGYRFVPEPEGADVVLYNTCSVRDHAEQKVRSRLGEMRLRKQQTPGLVVGVLGCMAERDGADLIARMPVVDVLCGPAELDKLPALLDNAVRTRAAMLADAPGLAAARSAAQLALQGDASRRSTTLAAAADNLELLDLSRAVSPEDHDGSAYVRITRGCNKFCTYCVVPHTRGAEVHRPPDHIVDECKRLADAGVIEVTLLGQTVNHYRYEHAEAVTINGVAQPQKGRTYKGGHRRDPFASARTTTFADLLRRIHDEVPAIKRLRFVTSYPRDFGDDVLEVMRDAPRICRYLHVPAQSGSDRMLKMMNRGYTVGEYLDFLDRARAFLHQPEIGRPLTVAGDMIVGFCTETEEDHKASLALLERARYKNCFIFKYSPRPGTTAYDRMADDVPDDVKRRRNNEMLALQSRISEAVSREQIGRTFEVMVQGVSRHEQKKATRAEHANAGAIPLTISARPKKSLADSPVDPPPESPPESPPVSLPDTPLQSPKGGASASHDRIQLTGRTDGDLIVHFNVPEGVSAPSLIGRLVSVRITNATALSLHGDTASLRD